MFGIVAITIFDYVTIVSLCKYNDIGFDYDNHEKVVSLLFVKEEVKNNFSSSFINEQVWVEYQNIMIWSW